MYLFLFIKFIRILENCLKFKLLELTYFDFFKTLLYEIKLYDKKIENINNISAYIQSPPYLFLILACDILKVKKNRSSNFDKHYILFQ